MSTEISKPNTNSNLPAHLQEEALGTEQLGQYVRPPRLKIVQAMAKEPYDVYDKGTVVVVPQQMVFAEFDKATKKGVPFKFIPLFFYPEWVQTNPLSKQPFIRERSMDPRSELAKKAKNQETWFEPHPEDPGLEVANREILNFIIMPVDHPLQGTPVVLSFSKANYKDGTNLASQIKLRKASIFGQVFEATVAERSNTKGQWHGLNISIPAKEEEKWATADQYGALKELYTELKRVHEEGLLQVDYDDVPESKVDTDSTEY